MLLVRFGADSLRGLHAFGAQLGRLRLEGRAHALEHRILHLLRQIDLGDAHIDEFDAQLLGERPRGFHHGVGEFRALGGDHLLQGALRDHALDAVLDGLAQARVGDLLAAAGDLVVAAQILDAPLDVEIDVELFLLARQEMLRLDTSASGCARRSG